MKRITVLLLLVSLMVSIALVGTGCAGDPSKKEIVGTWEGEIDLAPIFLAEMDDEDDAFSKHLELEDSYNVTYSITFADDGTCRASMDEDDVRKVIDDLLKVCTDALVQALKDTIKEQGLTVEAFEKEFGMSIEKYAETAFAELDLEDALDGELDEEGEYTIEDYELTISDEEDVTYTVEIKKDKLTFIDCTEEDDEFFTYAKDIAFKKK